MDHLIGLVGKDYVLVAADKKIAHSVVALKTDQDKILQLDNSKVRVTGTFLFTFSQCLAGGGERGDVEQFSEYVQRNMALYNFRNGYELSTHASAHFIRQQIAYLIRKNPHMCQMLLGGFDKDVGPSLYWIDYLGNMQQLNAGAHGYGGFFSLSVMDRHYKKGMNLDEGVALMKKCFEEINTRFLIGGAQFTLKVIDANGVRTL